MNKIFTKIAALSVGLAMAIGVGVAVGGRNAASVHATEEVYYTLDGTATGGSSGYATESDITQDSIAWKITGNTTQSPWRIGGNSLSSVERPAYSTTAMGSAITKVDLTVGTASSITVNSLKLIVASDSSFNNQIDEVTGTFAASSTITFNPTSPATDWATGAYYKFVFKVTVSGNNNKFVQFIKAEFYKESGTPTPTASLSIDTSKTLGYVGNDFELNATASNYTPTSWSWTAEPTGIVSIDFDEGYAIVTPESAGTTTITVSAPNGATSMTKTCAVTVTSKSGADTSNVLTVDDAILIANYTGTTTTTSSYYCEGVVDSLFSSKYPMLLGTSDDLEVFVDCSSNPHVYEGDTIRIHGPIFTYENNNKTVIQPEFANTSTVEIIKIPVSSVSATVSTPVPTGVTGGDLSSYLSVTVNGTNSRTATNTGWKVTNSSNTSVIAISGSDGKTFNSSSSVGTTTLTIASVDDDTKTTTVEVTLLDASTPVLQSVTVGGTPTKATQYVGQAFDWTGLTFTPVYSPAKAQTESITGANIVWDALVAGQSPTGTYTGDNDVSKPVTVTSVTVEADGIYSVHVSGDMNTKSYDENASWNYAGLVAKVTYKSDHETQVTPTSEVTWTASSTPKQLGVGTNKSVNVTATVGGVSSTAYPITGITVTEHVASVYGLYSGTLTSGDYIIASDTIAMGNTISSDRITYSDIESSIVDGKITDPDSQYVWHIEASGNYWTIYNAAADVYAAGTGVKNKAQLISELDASDSGLWSCSSTSSSAAYTFINKRNTTADVNAQLRYNSGYGFACYQEGEVTLYKLGFVAKTLSSITIDTEPNKTTYNEGETLDLTGLVVLANWSDSTSTELTSSDYTVTPSVSTALATSNDEVTISYTYNNVEKTASFGITVSNVPLSENDKILDATSLHLNGTSYAANNGNHKVDGVNFATTAVMLSGGTMQFQKTNGALSNAGVMFDGTSGAIKYLTVFMNSENADTIVVSESSDGTNYTTVAVSGTYSETGVNVYSFSAGSTYFKVSASTSTFAKIDRVVVELIDGASDSLTRARNAATAILNNLSGLCGEGGSGVVTQSQWNTLTSAVNTALGSDNVAKSILKNASRLEINNLSQTNLIIENAMYHYDACVSKFGFTADSSLSSAQAPSHIGASPFDSINDSSAPVAIVVISLVGLAAIGGYFLIRRRKEQ